MAVLCSNKKRARMFRKKVVATAASQQLLIEVIAFLCLTVEPAPVFTLYAILLKQFKVSMEEVRFLSVRNVKRCTTGREGKRTWDKLAILEKDKQIK